MAATPVHTPGQMGEIQPDRARDVDDESGINPQTIIRLEVRNLLRVQAVDIAPPPGEHLLVIGGRNANGKSSVLKALSWAFEGAKGITGEPIHRGGVGPSYVLAETEDYVITRNFKSNQKSELVVTSKNGKALPSPQAILDRLYSDFTFDPISFTGKTGQAQVKMLMDVLGLDFTALNAERATLSANRKSAEDRRKTLETRLSLLPFHPDAPTEPVSVSDLMADLTKAREANRIKDQAYQAEKQALNTLAMHQNSLDTIDTDIARLEAELAKRREGRTVAVQKIDESKATLARLQTELLALPRGDEDTPANGIRTAESINAQVQANANRVSVAKDLDAVRTEETTIKAAIQEIDATKERLISEAQFPVPGLAFGDDGLIYQGLPFDQASDAERMRVSIGIAKAKNAKLRVIVVRQGNDLDEDSLADVRRMAEEFGVQVWMERVGKGGEVSVVIEDGLVEEDRFQEVLPDDAPKEQSLTLPFGDTAE